MHNYNSFLFQEHQSFETLNGKSCLESTKLFGVIPSQTRFLTIGIPSVNRKKTNYLPNTLESLTKNLSDEQKKNVTIIVLFGDSNGIERSKRAGDIRKHFQKELDAGLILLIEPMMEYYPKINITRR